RRSLAASKFIEQPACVQIADSATTSVADVRITITVSLAISISIAPPGLARSEFAASERSMHRPPPQLELFAVGSDDPIVMQPGRIASSAAAAPMPCSTLRRVQVEHDFMGICARWDRGSAVGVAGNARRTWRASRIRTSLATRLRGPRELRAAEA